MSKTLLKITIPQPCSESWETMLPREKGRHCLSCQKTVVDFSKMADSEIIHYFQEYKGPTCGRFSETQLNRPVAEPFISQPSNRWAWIFSAMLLPFAGSSQGTQPKENFEISTPSVSEQKLVENHETEVSNSGIRENSGITEKGSCAEKLNDGGTNFNLIHGKFETEEEPEMQLKDIFHLAYQQLYFLYLNILEFLKSNI